MSSVVSTLSPAVPPPTPSEQARYNWHLYWDIAWYGILAGSSLAFLSIYLTRLGAASWQIGLLNAGPALMGLLLTMPLGRWLHDQSIGRAVFTMTIVHRMVYLPWIVLPLLFSPQVQIWSYLLLTLLMTIPGTAMAVGFNALYAAAVPPETRGHVAGIRNAIMSVTYVATTLASGFLLNRLPLEVGYPIVFGLGFVGAAMSTFHLWFLRRLSGREGVEGDSIRGTTGDHARPGSMRFMGVNVRSSVALRVFARTKLVLRPEILRTAYGRVVGALLFFHFAQYIPIALFPLYWVNELHFTDQQIGVGTAVFNSMVLIGSLRLGRMTERRGNLWIMVTGVLGLSLYPLIVAFTHGVTLYLIASVVGGAAWSMVGGALANYLLELAPRNDRPAHLAWYNLALNAGILLGSLSGPLLAGALGIRGGLLVGFLLRLLAALAIWLAGKQARQPLGQPVSLPANSD